MGDVVAKMLVLTVPDYGDGLVLLPADSIDAIRAGTDDEGEPLRLEDAMLDELDEALVDALLNAGLAQVAEPLGHYEVLVINEASRVDVIALAESMGYTVEQR